MKSIIGKTTERCRFPRSQFVLFVYAYYYKCVYIIEAMLFSVFHIQRLWKKLRKSSFFLFIQRKNDPRPKCKLLTKLFLYRFMAVSIVKLKHHFLFRFLRLQFHTKMIDSISISDINKGLTYLNAAKRYYEASYCLL